MAERTESEGFYEMLWDCDHCSAKSLLGKTQRHCAECGAPQNPDKRYFPTPEQAKAVDGHRYDGADRHCPSCSNPMGASAKNCTKCGSPLDGSKEVRGIAAPVAPARKRRIWPYVVGALLAIGVLIWFFFIRTKQAKLTVAAHRWERVVAIETYGDHPKQAWRDQVPGGASMPLCSRRERSKKQVEDGETCTTENVDKKDGTFEKVRTCKPKFRSEPVMDDWCSFTVRAWEKSKELKSTGTGTTAAWPAGAPAADTPAAIGAARSGARTEKLYLDFAPKPSDDTTCAVSDAVWRKYSDGQQVKVEVRARSGAVVCDGL